MKTQFDVIIEKLIELEAKFSLYSPVGTIPPPTEIINRKELCTRLDITEPTAIRWEKKRKIPSFRIGSNVRYNWPKVIAQLEGKTRGGGQC